MAGTDTLPWLGNIRQLAPLSDYTETPYGEDDSKSPFPVRPADRRSYTQIGVVWIRPAGLQVLKFVCVATLFILSATVALYRYYCISGGHPKGVEDCTQIA